MPRRRGKNLTCPATACIRLRATLKGFGLLPRANWRIIFRFEGIDAFDVELIDYH